MMVSLIYPKCSKRRGYYICRFSRFLTKITHLSIHKMLKSKTHKIKNPRNINILKPPVQAEHITSNFLKAVFHRFYLVHSWIHWPKLSLHQVNLNSHDLYPTSWRYYWISGSTLKHIITQSAFTCSKLTIKTLE